MGSNAEVFMKKSRSTIVDWYNLCRNVAIAEFQKRKKMESPGLVMQINESLFQNEDEVINNQNYGQRIQGPWIFDLCCKYDGILEKLIFKVEKRDRNILLPIILNEIEQGITIYFDKWRAYSNLNEHGFIHKTDNHSENVIDSMNWC
ncbi:DDE Tnp IS1595 domain-containing protein [Aphis craccivora]|uniref:DDE Tnp IS1595 domain-containing protein n=1 Tax=Aphis craccivora TaxID=307492 RepID=A0A6G0YQR3_APHCR|nr:DDE Tnp IS1595 domain-containing protein [Aphis craccivora]